MSPIDPFAHLDGYLGLLPADLSTVVDPRIWEAASQALQFPVEEIHAQNGVPVDRLMDDLPDVFRFTAEERAAQNGVPVDRLMEDLPDASQFPAEERAAQNGASVDPLMDDLPDVFRFTAEARATQNGVPVDRLMEDLPDAFQFPAEARATQNGASVDPLMEDLPDAVQHFAEARPAKKRRVNVDRLVDHPVFAQWHPTENTDINPEDLRVNSVAKAVWRCLDNPGHLPWKASIIKRCHPHKPTGCPECHIERRRSLVKSLAEHKVARQWHPTKNGELTPAMFRQSDRRKVWWLCAKHPEHEWQASITARCAKTNPTGCPDCKTYNRREIVPLLRDSEAAQFWDFEANKDLDFDSLPQDSRVLASWICKKGHRHQAQIEGRCRRPFCPQCVENERKSEMVTLAEHPVGKQFHPTKNGDKTPKDFSIYSKDKVVWQCPDNPDHFWETAVKNRTYHTVTPGCQVCKKEAVPMLSEHPLAKEIHPNNIRKAEEIRLGSKEAVLWRCSVNPEHRWTARVQDRCRSDGKATGCPECRNAKTYLSLRLSEHPVVAQWDYALNKGIDPKDFMQGSLVEAWWRCENKHSWKSRIQARCRNKYPSSCPTCKEAQRKATALTLDQHPAALEFHPTANGDLKPSDLTQGTKTEVVWLCKEGHVWTAKVQNRCRKTKATGCPQCKMV